MFLIFFRPYRYASARAWLGGAGPIHTKTNGPIPILFVRVFAGGAGLGRVERERERERVHVCGVQESGTCSVAVSQEFLNWGHLPLPEFRNWARLG